MRYSLSRRCINCNRLFYADVRKPTQTCSEDCIQEVRTKNLLAGREAYWSRPKPRESRRMQNLRAYWQRRADELDAKRRVA